MRLEELDLLRQGYFFSDGVYVLVTPQREIRCSFHANGNLFFRIYLSPPDYAWCRDTNEGPAYEVFFDDGSLNLRVYFYQGKIHRDISLGPANEYRVKIGAPLTREWIKNGIFVRDEIVR